MAVIINQLSDDKILVNDKLVYIDIDGGWNAILVNDKLVYIDVDGDWNEKIELTQSEAKALNNHLKAIK